MSPTHRKEWLKVVALGLACVVLTGLALGVRDMRRDDAAQRIDAADTRQLVDDTAQALAALQAFSVASRQSRIEFQARETFLLCSRDLEATVRPERRAEVARTCIGYETMAAALATETLRQARAGG